MPDEPRFLLGHGERLARPVTRPPRGSSVELPYSFSEALGRLAPEIRQTADDLANLPRIACPADYSVGVVTMHPSFIAKSYFPKSLLGSSSLRAVGSRPVSVTPEKLKPASASKEEQVEPNHPLPTTELYVAGRRNDFLEWADVIYSLNPDEAAATEMRRVELVRTPIRGDRIRLPDSTTNEEGTYEVVLHLSGPPEPEYILTAFEEFSLAIGVQPDFARILRAGSLAYFPVTGARQDVVELSQFSFLRVVRPVPHLRALTPIERSLGPAGASTPLPAEDAISPELVAAVFDGGLKMGSSVSPWTELQEDSNLAAGDKRSDDHGTKVSSAVLFGSLVPGQTPPRPYGRVHLHRVLDKNSGINDVDLYDVLQRITAVLERKEYEFVNLSLGPAGPIEDDEVHTWTAVLDQHMATGDVLTTVAVGNQGHLDHASGNARIEVPSDAVNVLSIGAADSSRTGWKRAEYSCIGPGRRPGVVKPDVLTFGGCPQEPFYAYNDASDKPAATQGTSFASPSALRLAMGVRAHFGEQLTPLALKALLIHTAESNSEGRSAVGWGKCQDDINALVECPEDTVRVVYQGSLVPAQVLRVPIPLPSEALQGWTYVTATVCFATPTDPQDPGNYTRAGLDVVFRPNAERFANNGTIPKPASFFKRDDYASENDLRTHGHKWETVLNRTQRFRGSSLLRPAFDIHYVAREGGGAASNPDPVRYAIVVTVSNRNATDLYSRVVDEYATVLQPLQPVIEIPVQV